MTEIPTAEESKDPEVVDMDEQEAPEGVIEESDPNREEDED